MVRKDIPMLFTIKEKAAYGMRSHVKGFKAHDVGTMAYADGGLPYTWIEK